MSAAIDITGMKWGKLTAIERAHGRKWVFACECGVSKEIDGWSVKSGKVATCGCLRPGVQTGETYHGRLTAIRPLSERKGVWLFRCACTGGSESLFEGRACNVISGNTKSCGCIRRASLEDRKVMAPDRFTAQFWRAIEENCRRRSKNGRIIAFTLTRGEAQALYHQQKGLCALSGLPIVFASHYTRRSEGTASLDRIDSKLGYERGNVQWVHKTINSMKMDALDAEFIEWCRKVVAHADRQQSPLTEEYRIAA